MTKNQTADYLRECLDYYKNISQTGIKSHILKFAKELSEMDEDSHFFVYFTPIILSTINGATPTSGLEIANIINEKYALKQATLNDNLDDLNEYITNNVSTYIKYLHSMQDNIYSLYFIDEIFKVIIQYICACISYKKAITYKDLKFLSDTCRCDARNLIETYDLTSKITKDDGNEIIGPVLLKDLKFLLHITDKNKKLFTIESKLISSGGVPFFFPVINCGAINEDISLWFFLSENYFDIYRNYYDILSLYGISVNDFLHMSPFEKALSFVLLLLEADFDNDAFMYHIDNIEETIKYIENNCSVSILIKKFKSHIIRDNNFEESRAFKVHVLPESIKNSITPTSLNMYLDVTLNSLDLSELFQVATADIKNPFHNAQYLYYYHFEDGIVKDEYMNREILHYTLTENEFSVFEDRDDLLKPKTRKSEKGLIEWIINQEYSSNVLKYNGEPIILKFSYQTLVYGDPENEIKNIKLFDSSLSPCIKIKI